jgi:hypothetical protein
VYNPTISHFFNPNSSTSGPPEPSEPRPPGVLGCGFICPGDVAFRDAGAPSNGVFWIYLASGRHPKTIKKRWKITIFNGKIKNFHGKIVGMMDDHGENSG